jgi:hypothetical protein
MLSRFRWYRKLLGGKWQKICLMIDIPERPFPKKVIKYVKIPVHIKERYWVMEDLD